MKDIFSKIPSLAKIGIGSLPYHDTQFALDFAMAMDIPFFPTLPSRHPSEGMLAQSVRGFPGIELLSASALKLDIKTWEQEGQYFVEKLNEAFNRNRYVDWLPDSQESLWPAFLSILTTASKTWVKTQITGPLTILQAITNLEAQSTNLQKEILDALVDLLTAKALAMHDELRFRQKQTLLFIDEPGLCVWKQASVLENWAFEKLSELFQELKNYGIKLGLHCCGNADFAKLFELPIDYLSIDALLSMDLLLKKRKSLKKWLQKGGRLSLGVVPTRQKADWKPSEVAEKLKMDFRQIFPQDPSQAEQILAESLLSPTCGLGLTPVGEVKWVFAMLHQVQLELNRLVIND